MQGLTFSWSGNTEFVIVLFIIFVIGFAITGLASFNNLADIPSLPVAFLTLVLVTKIKKRSIKTYFFERCIGGPKSKDFWPTIKPFITNKGSHFTKNIILCEKDEIINDQNMVAECFKWCWILTWFSLFYWGMFIYSLYESFFKI
jgi:hypothetical protein